MSTPIQNHASRNKEVVHLFFYFSSPAPRKTAPRAVRMMVDTEELLRRGGGNGGQLEHPLSTVGDGGGGGGRDRLGGHQTAAKGADQGARRHLPPGRSHEPAAVQDEEVSGAQGKN
ncbi:hypothetical protein WMY93_024279 [Mugilogobius chulae]|uniref:Uncharacterized protein n=1 Tax=Mugilogobius chulae TaxID=88201 RepID=A0AAW0NB35_9GOBI